MNESKFVKRGQVVEVDEAKAVAKLASQIQLPDMAGVIFFASSEYNPVRLATALNEHFHCPLVGCTSAGEIGSGFQNGGIVGLGLSAEAFRLHPMLIANLASMDMAGIKQDIDGLRGNLTFSEDLDPDGMFGLLLVDGLSLKEEQLVASLYSLLNGVELIGGSAGDELKFEQTRVFAEGCFHTSAAMFALIETKLDFKTFKLQHYEPTDDDMVITEAIPHKRIVNAINGAPAAQEYAQIIGLDVAELKPLAFSTYPVMLEIGNDWYVRSIEKVNDDGSLTFYCAIDDGLPLTLAASKGLVTTLRKDVERIGGDFERIDLTLGCDCILRRLEMIDREEVSDCEDILKQINFLGFSTFGEQYNGVHVNQTLVGVTLGTMAHER